MSAVLRATGRDFDVDAFLPASTLNACGVHRRGEPRFPGKQTDSRQHERSEMNIVASFNEFTKQVAEATTFLLAHKDEIRRLVTFPGVETVTLDFGIERRDVVVQSDHLPAALIRVAGALGLSLELSQYPPPDAKDEQSPR
jgi:hypothetical protein